MESSYKVLIIDDEDLIRLGIRSCIDWSATHFRIAAEAADAREALRLIDEDSYDLIITDLIMPDMNGLEFIQTLKKKHPNLPCIIISGSDCFEYAQKAIELRVLGYLLKPIDPEKLLQLLHQCDSVLTQQEDFALEHQRTCLTRALAHPSNIEQDWGHNLDGNFFLLLFISDQYKFSPIEWLRNSVYQCLASQQTNVDNLFSFDVPRYPGIYGVVFHSNSLTVSEYRHLAAALDKHIRSTVGENPFVESCSIGLAYPFTSTKALFSAFKQAIHNLKMRPFLACSVYSEISCVRKPSEEFKKNISASNDSIRHFLQTQKFSDAKIYISSILDKSNAAHFTPSIANNLVALLCGHLSLLIALYDLPDLSKDIERLQSPAYLVYFSSISKWRDDLLRVIDHIDTCFSDFNHDDDVVFQIQNYLCQNYMLDWKLAELSALFYLNPSYLSHLFKKKTGLTLTAYTEELRLKNASELLIQTNTSIGEIASTVGYSDSNYFTKRFRKKTGMSPVAYRNQHKKARTNSANPKTK